MKGMYGFFVEAENDKLSPELLQEIREHIPKNKLIRIWLQREREMLDIEYPMLSTISDYSILLSTLNNYFENNPSIKKRMQKIAKHLNEQKADKKKLVLYVLNHLTFVDIKRIIKWLDISAIKQWCYSNYVHDGLIMKMPPYSWMYECGGGGAAAIKEYYADLLEKYKNTV